MTDPNVENLIALIDRQPVSVAFEVQNDFFHYTDGVYYPSEKNCGKRINHAVLAVGYTVVTDPKLSFFLVKNSWNKTWGEQGYFRIRLGSNKSTGTCGIANSYDGIVTV